MPGFVDLFSGCGGLTWGFVASGWEPVFAVESDGDAVQTYGKNFGDVAIMAGVENVPFRGVEADAIIAGLPCQGFTSLSRRSIGRDRRNGLFREVVRAIRAVEPRVFLVENVPYFLDSWSGTTFIRMTKRLGYHIESQILDAVDYGVPQFRRRAFVMGTKRGKPTWPDPLGTPPKTVRDAIGNLPFKISGRGMDRTTSCGNTSMERIRHIPVGGSRTDLPRALMAPCWRRHGSGAFDVMGRLRWGEPSVSVRTEFIKPEKGRYLHPEANRPITLREGALLQSFPKEFRFCGSMTSIARQIGNAVPPVLSRRLATELLAIA